MNVGFYSYKGGVGRTLTMVNLGLELVKRGKRVCLVDVDLEAPGVHHLLCLEPEEHQSLIEHLIWQDIGILPTRVMEIDSLFGSTLSEWFEHAPQGSFFVLPCIPDRTKLRKIPEQEIIPFFKESMTHLTHSLALDYVLLDSRTGFARFAPLALKAADAFVLVTRLDSQNARGMKDLLRITSEKPHLVVASMVPEPDREIPSSTRAEKIKSFEKEAEGAIDIVIPFYKRLLFGDCIPILHFDADCAICRASQILADRVVEMKL